MTPAPGQSLWSESLNLGAPVWLHALWAAPAILLLLAFSFHRSRRLLTRLAEPSMLERLAASVSWPRRWLKAALIALGAALLAVNIVFVVDVSRSMLARDLAPNRLERAKRKSRSMVSGLRTTGAPAKATRPARSPSRSPSGA